jgi:hypothetical protein
MFVLTTLAYPAVVLLQCAGAGLLGLVSGA